MPSAGRRAPCTLYALLGGLLACATVAELRLGTIGIDVAALLRGHADPMAVQVLLQLRLPRLLVALLCGAALAQAGVAMQALFRNPLAEPGLVGVSAGAALAAAAVFAGVPALRSVGIGSALGPVLLPAAAFAGGLLAALLVLAVARREGVTRTSTLLLTGVAVNAFVSAMIGLLAAAASEEALRGFTLWLYGDPGRAGWSELAITGPILGLVLLFLPRESRTLDALLLGDAEAAHLGFDVEALRRRILLLAVLGTACAVALAGLIGFVGLVAPQAIRLVAGPGHRRLLPLATLLGAALLVVADVAARTLVAPVELPVGVLTALLGAPFFLMLLRRHRELP